MRSNGPLRTHFSQVSIVPRRTNGLQLAYDITPHHIRRYLVALEDRPGKGGRERVSSPTVRTCADAVKLSKVLGRSRDAGSTVSG